MIKRKAQDLTHRKFCRLTGIRENGKASDGAVLWLFKCECGNEKIIRARSVISGRSRSCGCLIKATRKHLPEGEASFNVLVYTYKTNAKKRNYEFSLTNEEFRSLTKQNCFYCGIPPGTAMVRKRTFFGNYTYNGIDRVDNTKGYLLDNCVTCCSVCNYSKLDRTHKEFVEWVAKVYHKTNSG